MLQWNVDVVAIPACIRTCHLYFPAGASDPGRDNRNWYGLLRLAPSIRSLCISYSFTPLWLVSLAFGIGNLPKTNSPHHYQSAGSYYVSSHDCLVAIYPC